VERRSSSTDRVVLLAVTACAVPLGLAVARLVTIDRDAPFHLARVRMLAELDVLSVEGLTELVDGSTHPGYAIPLWHACIALAADVAGSTRASPTGTWWPPSSCWPSA
jgi:hypothetical protein